MPAGLLCSWRQQSGASAQAVRPGDWPPTTVFLSHSDSPLPPHSISRPHAIPISQPNAKQSKAKQSTMGCIFRRGSTISAVGTPYCRSALCRESACYCGSVSCCRNIFCRESIRCCGGAPCCEKHSAVATHPVVGAHSVRECEYVLPYRENR